MQLPGILAFELPLCFLAVSLTVPFNPTVRDFSFYTVIITAAISELKTTVGFCSAHSWRCKSEGEGN